MRVLQICSDWKWTGPAEPMLLLLEALRERGHCVELACPEPPDPGAPSLAERARARGIEPLLALEAHRGARWRRDSPDGMRLRALLRDRRIEVVHTWHTRDHWLAWRAGRGLGAQRPFHLRSLSSAEELTPRPWNRWFYGAACDALLCVSQGSAEGNRERRIRSDGAVYAALGAVRSERFVARDGGRLRRELGIPEAAPVVGIVARVQRHRRFELLLAAHRLLLRELPEARLLIVGRGTHIEEVAVEPARRLGISDRVIFAGYREEDYPEVFAAMSCFTYLVPGSDGSCRALLEAAAAGLPAVTTRRGALPEIVLDGETGLLVDEDPSALAEGWRRVLTDPALSEPLGIAAAERARRDFSPSRLARDVESIYEAALSSSSCPSPASAMSSR